MKDKTDESADESAETTSIALIKRKCETCGGVAVPIEGVGTDCEDSGCSGEYVERDGVFIVSVSPKVAENYREEYPGSVAE